MSNIPKTLKNPKGSGKPKSAIDFERLTTLCQYPCSVEWCAAVFGVSKNTIINRIKEETGLSWGEFSDNCLAPTRFSLMQAAVDQAKAGNGKALALCLRKFCDWETKRDPSIQINNVLTGEQLDSQIISLLKELKIT